MTRPFRSAGPGGAGLLAALLLAMALGACQGNGAAAEYERQRMACSVAEGNGLLDSAVQACGIALAIAEEQAYAPAERSGLLFSLGRLERQRGNFREAETLLRRSLAIEETPEGSTAAASRLIELAMILAGQDQWLEGAGLLERATPMLPGLSGAERKAAANAFRGFGLRLEMQGYDETAVRFKATAMELEGS